ncbi:MAG TPA: hypothetical protein VEJ36_03560 [Nitrososphaerales archaeon]|nr:hypothetical protein [Nitrososphaerales archaeon]
MEETYVELQDIPVMRVKADMKGDGPPAAFGLLESKLTSLRGRKFYGVYHKTPEGEEYFACVAKTDDDNPDKVQLESGVITGGSFVRRKVMDWKKVVSDGQLPRLFNEMVMKHINEVDPDRFSIEFYRSSEELLIFLPVKTALA